MSPSGASPHVSASSRAVAPADAWLANVVRLTWRVKLLLHLEVETEQRLREQAEQEAIRVFGRNLHDLLLAAPAGQRVTMGLDPGIRTGVKVAVVDGTGKVLETATVYPHEPRKDWAGSLRTLGQLAARHGVQLISIGNGTASRETDKLAADLMQAHPGLPLTKVMVSEAGASVYSASELAAKEFPDLDVSLRGAVSIARRLQDPLAELVRIDPKAIGVGQYQHDVSPFQLGRTLDAVVEDCVNAVGADLNTASVPLLARISGLSETLAGNIVAFRDANGPFRRRAQLLDVPRVGERTFQQAAGFLRVVNGDNPLDASAVHPEAYPVVERIVARTGLPVGDLIGKSAVLKTLRPDDFADAQFGVPTVKDILTELDKPNRDPRPEFKTAAFKDGVQALGDLVPGMQLEGVVTNVANFGAFVDIGVHQDGLVHVSQLADRFVKDPREVVKAGDIVQVRVLEVDASRKRIALTMKRGELRPTPATGSGTPAAPSGAPPPRPASGAGAPSRPRTVHRVRRGLREAVGQVLGPAAMPEPTSRPPPVGSLERLYAACLRGADAAHAHRLSVGLVGAPLVMLALAALNRARALRFPELRGRIRLPVPGADARPRRTLARGCRRPRTLRLQLHRARGRPHVRHLPVRLAAGARSRARRGRAARAGESGARHADAWPRVAARRAPLLAADRRARRGAGGGLTVLRLQRRLLFLAYVLRRAAAGGCLPGRPRGPHAVVGAGVDRAARGLGGAGALSHRRRVRGADRVVAGAARRVAPAHARCWSRSVARRGLRRSWPTTSPWAAVPGTSPPRHSRSRGGSPTAC